MTHEQAIQMAVEALEALLNDRASQVLQAGGRITGNGESTQMAIAALAALRSADDWRPIGEAPKDGTPIILLCKEHQGMSPDGPVTCAARAWVGWWNPDGSSWVDETGGFDGAAVILDTTGNWIVSSGWLQPNEVSHWQPLPAPPRKES